MSRVEKEVTERPKHMLTQSFKILFWVLPTNSRALTTWEEPGGSQPKAVCPFHCFVFIVAVWHSKTQTLDLRSPELVYCCGGKAVLGGNCPHWRETESICPASPPGGTPLVSDAITIITLNCIFFFFFSLFRSGLMKERQQIPSSSFVNDIGWNPWRICPGEWVHREIGCEGQKWKVVLFW